MGGPTNIRISPAVTVNLSFGIMSRLPLIAMGTIGTFDLIARVNPPFLKGWIEPSGLLEPSGKMTTDIPSRIF
jgi:hypothetical protein